MKAIILAAGVGSRMGKLTKFKPKCLLQINNIPIIRKQINSLREAGIEDVSAVLGYKEEMVKEATKDLDIFYFLNDKYESAGMLESLLRAKEKINGEFILVYGDIYFEPVLIKRLLVDSSDICLVVNKIKKRSFKKENAFEIYYGKKIEKGATKVKIENGLVRAISKSLSGKDASAEYIGIVKFSPKASLMLKERLEQLVASGEIVKYPSPSHLFKEFIEKGKEVRVVFTNKKEYAELDYEEDLKEAKDNFDGKINGVVFDAEDVIYYRDKEVFKPITDFFKKNEFKITAEDFKKEYDKYTLNLYKGKLSKDNHLRKILNAFKCPKNKEFFEEFAKVFRANYSNIKINKEIKLVLKNLKNKGIKIGVLTDTFASEEKKREYFKSIGLDGFFDAISCSSATGFTKDQKESYRDILGKLRLEPAECIFVGHKKYEMAGAKKAKVKSVSIIKDQGEDYYLPNLKNLEKLIYIKK